MNTTTRDLDSVAMPGFAAYARQFGVYDAEGKLSIPEALEGARLNFTAFLGDVLGQPEGTRNTITIGGYRAVLRRDADDELAGVAVVGPRYRIVQHSEAFGFAQMLVDEYAAMIVAASEVGPMMGSGARAFMVARLGRTTNINDLDVHDTYIAVSNSLDGSSGVVGTVVPIHVATGAQIETPLPGAPQRFILRHSGDTAGKMSEARQSVAMVERWSEAYAEASGALLAAPMNSDLRDAFTHAMLAAPAGAKRAAEADWAGRRDDLRMIWEGLPDHGYGRHSGYGAFLALCTYVDTAAKASRSAHPELTRAERTLNGEAAKLKHAAWKWLNGRLLGGRS